MNPRLTSSKKWTSLPTELCTQIREVFEENFADATKKGQIIVEGRIYPQELLLRVGYLEKGRLQQANVEISLDFDPNKQNALQHIHFAIDCAASIMHEYFAGDQDLENFPRQWKAIDFENKPAFVQISTVNSQLEAEADRLLGEGADQLVSGEDLEEEQSAVITMLGLEDTEEDFPEEADSGESTNDDDESDSGSETIH